MMNVHSEKRDKTWPSENVLRNVPRVVNSLKYCRR